MGADKNLLVKDHTHTFVNKDGQIGGMIPCLILNKVLLNNKYAYIYIYLQIAFGNAECCICVSFILRNMLLIL